MSLKIAYNTKAEAKWNPKHVATFQNHITLSVQGDLHVKLYFYKLKKPRKNPSLGQ